MALISAQHCYTMGNSPTYSLKTSGVTSQNRKKNLPTLLQKHPETCSPETKFDVLQVLSLKKHQVLVATKSAEKLISP